MGFHSFRVTLLLGVASAGMTVATPALAQSADNAGTTGDIIVTARRVEERLQDVPISITVFNQQQLETHNVATGEDLAKYTPSLAVNTRYGSDRATFAIRGFNQETGTAPSVGTYFDEVVGLRAATVLVPGGDGAGPGLFFDLQNVQVLKGPQGTLFGINTTGGAVLLVPQKPTDRLEGYVQGSIGNYQDREIEAVLNLPLNDTFKLRFGVEHKQRDGYLINRSGIGPRDFDDEHYTAVRASMVANLTPDLENYTVVSYVNSDTHGAATKLTAADVPAGIGFLAVAIGVPAVAQLANEAAQHYGFYDFEQTVNDTRSKLEEWQIINTTTWKASDTVNVKNIISYGQLKSYLTTALASSNWNTSSIAFSGLAQPGYPYIFFAVHGDPILPTAYQSTFTEEFRLNGQSPSGGLTWQGGVYLELSDPLGLSGLKTPLFASCTDFSTLHCTNPWVFPLGSISTNRTRTSYRDFGIYAQATQKLTDQLKLTAGLRYTHDSEVWDVTSENQLLQNAPAYGVIPGPITCTAYTGQDANCHRHLTESSHAPTWLVDLEYTPSPDYLFYAKYARGYRAGAVEAAIVPPFTQLKPEKLDTYEIGAKTSFNGTLKGTFNIAAFYNDFRNQQLQLNFNPIPGTGLPATAVPINAGKSRMWGIEVGATLQPFEGMQLTVDYAYLNTKILAMPDLSSAGGGLYFVNSQYQPGQTLPQTPRNKIVLGATYTLPLSEDIGKIALGATFTHTDKQIFAPGDINDPDPVIQAAGIGAATNLLDLSLTWTDVAKAPIDLMLFATNVTADKYYTFSSGTGVDGAETQGVGAPRMYGVRVKVHFGQR